MLTRLAMPDAWSRSASLNIRSFKLLQHIHVERWWRAGLLCPGASGAEQEQQGCENRDVAWHGSPL